MDRFERIRPFIEELQAAIKDSLDQDNERISEVVGKINDAGFELGIAIGVEFQFREHRPEPLALSAAPVDAAQSAEETVNDLKFLKRMRIKIE